MRKSCGMLIFVGLHVLEQVADTGVDMKNCYFNDTTVGYIDAKANRWLMRGHFSNLHTVGDEACTLIMLCGLLFMGWQGNVATTTFSAGAFDLTRRKVVQYVSQT
jgi:hypothetical protein